MLGGWAMGLWLFPTALVGHFEPWEGPSPALSFAVHPVDCELVVVDSFTEPTVRACRLHVADPSSKQVRVRRFEEVSEAWGLRKGTG